MTILKSNVFVASIIVAASLVGSPAIAQSTAERTSVEKIVAGWPERPRLGANEMMAKYGPPQEATSERLVWHNAGAFKRIAVLKLETPHDFPLPHVDFLEHTVAYNVPQNKVGDLIEFDASSTINRTVGELSARCDLEGHNILTLNLDHDIIIGKKTVEQARQAFGEIVQQDVTGKHPAYVEALQFQPVKASAAAFSDKPVIPGSPVRFADDDADAKAQIAANKGKETDAEILATVIAVDMNEVLAAAEAQKKEISQQTLEYAKMLHQEHGLSMGKTMKLGQQMGVTPTNTATVEKLQVKGAGELAALVSLEGSAFERGYLEAMVNGHTEVLSMIDGKLIETAKNDALKKHLTETRTHIAAHLEKAKELQDSM
ncbi:DUF4142 domain-containing protein [Pseudomonas sp. Hz4]